MSIERFRLNAATVLAWIAQRITPPIIRPIFYAHAKLMETSPEQIAMGRRYGVVTFAWSLDAEGRACADKIEKAGLSAMSEARAALEAAPFNAPISSPRDDSPVEERA